MPKRLKRHLARRVRLFRRRQFFDYEEFAMRAVDRKGGRIHGGPC